MLAAQLDSVTSQQWNVHAAFAQVQKAILEKAAVLSACRIGPNPKETSCPCTHLAQAQEPGSSRPSTAMSCGALEIQDAPLGGRIGFHRAVAVEVVGGDVQDGRHLGEMVICSSWKLEISRIARSSGCISST